MLSLQEIRQLGSQEFLNEVDRTKKDLMRIRFNVAAGHSKETHILRNLKKYLAQLLTIQKESKKTEEKVIKKTKGAEPVEKPIKKRKTVKNKTIKAKK